MTSFGGGFVHDWVSGGEGVRCVVQEECLEEQSRSSWV